MKTGLKMLALAGTILAAPIFANAASAASIIGLVDGKTLVWVDPATKKVTGKADIKGAASVVGIDVRPADGMLYALTADGGIYTVDAKSGAATMKSKLSEQLKAGVTVTVDFNPVADRLRVITSDGTNLRVNVDDGKATVDGALKFKDADGRRGRLHELGQSEADRDRALRHRRHDRLAGVAGAAERRHPEHDRLA